MGFFMDGLDAEAYDRKYGDGVLVRRILGYFRPTLRLMVIAALMVLFGSLTDTTVPLILARGVDTVAGSQSTAGIAVLAAAILVAGVLSWLFNFVRQTCSARAVADVVLRLRRDAFDAVLARDMSFYDEFPSAKIVSRVTSDTEGFTNVVTLVLNLMSQMLLVVLIAAVMFYLNAVAGAAGYDDRAGGGGDRPALPTCGAHVQPARPAHPGAGEFQRAGGGDGHRRGQGFPPASSRSIRNSWRSTSNRTW